ncbi:MAG: hypothetical protein ABL921_34480 [Pirellula sp.]
MLPTFVTEHELVKKSLSDSLYVGRTKGAGFASELPERHYKEGDKHGNSKSGQKDDSREFKQSEAEMFKTREELMLLSKEEIVGIWSDLGPALDRALRPCVWSECDVPCS